MDQFSENTSLRPYSYADIACQAGCMVQPFYLGLPGLKGANAPISSVIGSMVALLAVQNP